MLVSPPTTLIKFDVKKRIVTWETADVLYAGTYKIQIFGTLKSFNNSVSFLLEV